MIVKLPVDHPNWVNHCLNLIYQCAHNEREEQLEQQLELFLRPVNEVEPS